MPRPSQLFTVFDLLTSKHDVYKIQTIGDAYVLVSGLPFVSDAKPPEAATNCMLMAIDMLKAVARVRTTEQGAIEMRLGVHTGETTMGVIGQTKLRYDMWGKDAQVANKLEALGLPSAILFSEVKGRALAPTPTILIFSVSVLLICRDGLQRSLEEHAEAHAPKNTCNTTRNNSTRQQHTPR